MGYDLEKGARGGYTLLTGLFNLALLLFCLIKRPKQVGWKDWILMALATFRMSRLVAYDKIMETYRSPVVETVPHDSGAGDTTQARAGTTGIKRALGEMISCPICNGTWIAAGLVYGLSLAPRYTRTLMTIMSVAGATEIAQAAFEAMQWNGELARHRAGEQMRINRQHPVAPVQPAKPVPPGKIVPSRPMYGEREDAGRSLYTPSGN